MLFCSLRNRVARLFSFIHTHKRTRTHARAFIHSQNKLTRCAKTVAIIFRCGHDIGGTFNWSRATSKYANYRIWPGATSKCETSLAPLHGNCTMAWRCTLTVERTTFANVQAANKRLSYRTSYLYTVCHVYEKHWSSKLN